MENKKYTKAWGTVKAVPVETFRRHKTKEEVWASMAAQEAAWKVVETTPAWKTWDKALKAVEATREAYKATPEYKNYKAAEEAWHEAGAEAYEAMNKAEKALEATPAWKAFEEATKAFKKAEEAMEATPAYKVYAKADTANGF